MIGLSRVVSAMLPARSLRASAFRLRRLATLAGLSRVVHHLLVTTAERFRLRARVLIHGFRIVVRGFRRDTSRAAHDESRWRSIDVLRTDFRVLNAEALESYHVLLLSLDRDEALRTEHAPPR